MARSVFGTAAISQEQLGRILDRVIEGIRFEGPTAMKVGETVRFELAREQVEFPGVIIKPWYFIRGFQVGDELEFENASTSARYLADFYRDWPASSQASFPNPGFDFTPTEVGSVVLRVRVVFAAFSGVRHANMNVDWGQDEESMFEGQPEWYRVIDLEYVVEVER